MGIVNCGMRCLFCGGTPKDGYDLYRLNDKGEAGLWVCGEHLPRTDVKPHPDVVAIVSYIKRTARGR